MLTVGEVMTRDAVTVTMDHSLKAIREIFETSQFHHRLVEKDNKLTGIISDRDLLKHISPFIGSVWMERPQDINTLSKRAHQIMRRPLLVTASNISVDDASVYLLHERVTCLPVVDADYHIEGIVTWRDLLTHCTFCKQSQNDAA